MTLDLCIDLANYSVIPSPVQVKQLAAIGVKRAIVGTSFGIRASGQLAMLEAAGIVCEEYQFPERLIQTKRRWWVDCETPPATRAATRNAMSKGAAGVYTRRGWWYDNLHGWDFKAEFPDALLWDARYVHADGPCAITEALRLGGDVRRAIEREYALLGRFVPYGGFREAAITQWHNSITIYGVNVDLNHYAAPVVPAEGEDDMKPYLVWDGERKRIYLVGPFGAAWITQGAEVKKLEAQFGAMTIAYSAATIDAIGAA